MSTPEWMKKFNEIGQKGEEEVTAMGDEGFVKTAEPRRTSFSFPPERTRASISSGGATNTSGERSSSATPDTPGTGKSYSSRDPPAESSSAYSSEMISSSAISSGAISSAASTSYASTSYESVNTEDAYEEESVDESGVESSADKGEDFGESWVNDQEKLKRHGADDVNPGESFITEEVFVDEDGNEIMVDENGNEIQVDDNGNEVHNDENGNEIQIDEEGDKTKVGEDGIEIQEEEILVDESAMDLEPQQEQDPNRGMYDEMPTPNEMDESRKITLPLGAAPIDNFEEQRRILGVGKKGNRSRMSWCIPLLVFAIIIASVLLVLFLVVYNEDRALYGMTPTMAPTPTNYLQLEPTDSSSIDAAATTEFDDIKNDCRFDSLGLVQPNVIDQCRCGNENVDILANDVRVRWRDLLEKFIPTIFSEWNEPMNSCSPKNQALLWMSSGINNGGEIDNLYRLQRYVLAMIYYEQGGTEWLSSGNWLSEKNVCEWEGVQCNDKLYVRILNLDQNGLRGQISEAPTLLNAIEAYFVANNNLSGSIPDKYFSDDSLRYIDFSGNNLSGEFPSNISKKSKLTRINLSSNNLKGTIPGGIKKIADLEVLNIESNAFSGTLPSSLFTLSLIELSIGGNKFSGTVPEDLPDVSTLTDISLGPNMFTGDLPTSLDKLSALERLSIVGIPGLRGRLPASYGLSLRNLVELSISDTNVEGDVPDLYSGLTKLHILRLSNNNLRGKIPSTLSLLTNLKTLSLNGNDLSGTIPSDLGLLSSLQDLELHTNSFSGTIPDDLGNLYNLRTLTFGKNFMNGRVPSEVCALRGANLYEFVVDCPVLVGESEVDGIICGIPDCCTECL